MKAKVILASLVLVSALFIFHSPAEANPFVETKEVLVPCGPYNAYGNICVPGPGDCLLQAAFCR